MTKKPKDNSTFAQKAVLRREALALLAARGVDPVVLETHGGQGKLYDACYADIPRGVVLERDESRALFLARQRPMWSVYCAESAAALLAGAGAHLEITLLDVDPYGECWPTLAAFFGSARPFAPRMVVAVNDGMRQYLATKCAWRSATLRPMVERYGNDLHPVYLEVCEELLRTHAAQAGYGIERFGGYYCGHNQAMTHFMALLERSGR